MEQRAVWDDLVGDAWVRNAAVLDAHGLPFGLAAMDRLGPVDGQRVLDVGCGTGGTTRELARRGADAVGVDLSERMIAHARAEAAGRAGVEHRVGTVAALDPDEPFDALFSRFGVMFFDDAVAGFAHLRSLTRPGGSLAFAAWDGPFENPWMSTPVLATIPLLGPPALPGPEEPGPFSLAPPERAREVLEAAGWSDIDVDVLTIDQPYEAASVEAAATTLTEDNPVIAAGLAAHPDLRAEVHAAVVDALRPNVRDGTLVFQASAMIASAHA
ncbi:methyltransferase domain-containing protein [Aquihabitans sp. McL0605]|uniref:class I SAM-dependent methyltransferase n=1 Tax=Aquihabitans sp. McL0605 TaxID=3415671 RepID=UPI003CF7C8A8